MAKTKKTVKRNGTDAIVTVDKLGVFKEKYDETVDSKLASYQTKTDNTLQTTAKQIVPAINELNSKTTAIYRPMGSVETYEDLPTDASVGDVYDVIDEHGQNYAWTAQGTWDALGAEIDLSNYVTQDELSSGLATKQKTLSAGAHITLTDKGSTVEISTDGGLESVDFADITGEPEDNDALKNALDAKQNTLTAGNCISLNSETGVISVDNFATDEDIESIFE